MPRPQWFVVSEKSLKTALIYKPFMEHVAETFVFS